MSRDVVPSVTGHLPTAPRRALLVGIDEYDDEDMSRLSCARRDVEAVRELLARHDDGTPNYECLLLPEGTRLTRWELNRVCKEFFTNCVGSDVVFYFAGHGVYEAAGGQLVTTDGREHDWGVSMQDVATLAAKSDSRSVVIFLDCCHAGAFGGLELARRAFDAMSAIVPENVSILAATRAAEVALEEPPHGRFTSAVLCALGGRAADPTTGEITPLSISSAIEQHMRDADQQPVFKLHVSVPTMLRACKLPIVDYQEQRRVPRDLFPSANVDSSGKVPTGVRVAAAILPHHGSDRALVYDVARELGRRGVLTWMDPFDGLMRAPERGLRAAAEQATMAPFVSDAFLGSDWCTREIRSALDAGWTAERFVPVYLGDRATLATRDRSLRRRFFRVDGEHVVPIGIADASRPRAPDPAAVATAIANATYQRVIDADWRDALVVIDQRGAGERDKQVTLPKELSSAPIPMLVFRTDIDARRAKKIAFGEDWGRLAERVSWGLANAFGSRIVAQRTLRVYGLAQIGLFWLIGRHFDRTNHVDLDVYGRDGIVFTNRRRDRDARLGGGDPRAAAHVPSTPIDGRYARVAIGVGPRWDYESPVAESLRGSVPLYWIDPGHIHDSGEAMTLVANLVAAISHVARAHGASDVALFWMTAAPVAALAAAEVTSHLGPKVRFIEFDHAERTYHELPMPEEG